MISIIIPVYNVAPYIEECLLSVINQTYTGGLEVIVVDDCGTDNSMEIAERVIAQNKRTDITFRVIHHEKNRGLSAARNTGIREAKGDYVYFIDSDDTITSDCLSSMYAMVEKHSDVNIVFAGAYVNKDNYKWLDYRGKSLPEYSEDEIGLQYSMLKRYDYGMTAWNKLISMQFIIRNNLFFDEGYAHEDEIWNFRASSFIESAAFIIANTYYYNIRPSSIITTSSKRIRWDRLFLLWRKMTEYISGRNKDAQISGLCQFVLEETQGGFPRSYKWELFQLYFIMASKVITWKSFLYLLQGILGLINFRYGNRIVSKRLVLL